MDQDITAVVAEGPLSTIRTRHLFTMRLDVRPIVPIGSTPNGFRRIGFVTGGEIVGERIRGKVLNKANDWQVKRPDGSVTLDVRLAFETDSGALVTMAYRGLRHGPAEVIERLERGENVDPSSYYFRIAPIFETANADLMWLNGVFAIGTGHRFPQGPIYNIFEVL
ncbi:DUF3237 domain-containing protein [Nguyenibacter vanlangensis]|uniref:UPF0311 protein HUK84_00450 n=1 Tax=Nguyenibacter vanlangensis TaxID=1216886 RepID=A0A7Y7ISQ7_9PROT|nr:DUF3237 domain-containing protein [Nguyenibacter vanlangensis]NVN09636.1 DUF3237 domain-containing protein [Nguyenibacter vanlangensis]